MPKRFKARKDLNHNEIVAVFKKLKCRVLDLSALGHGYPDLLVGVHGSWHLVEIKNTKQAYGKRGLNSRQLKRSEEMGGFAIVSTIDEAVSLVASWRETASAQERGIVPVVHKWSSAEDMLKSIGAEGEGRPSE